MQLHSQPGAQIPITDGDHEKMAFANNRVYVGALGCTVEPGTAANTVRGCLSIFNTSSSAAVFPTESSFRQDFDVTGLQPISGRNIIYVVQGAETRYLRYQHGCARFRRHPNRRGGQSV